MSLTMAKKKKAADDDRHKYTVVSFRPRTVIKDIVQARADHERRSLARMVEILLEEALIARGLWTPEGEEG
jgi:hypothetical protein